MGGSILSSFVDRCLTDDSRYSSFSFINTNPHVHQGESKSEDIADWHSFCSVDHVYSLFVVNRLIIVIAQPATSSRAAGVIISRDDNSKNDKRKVLQINSKLALISFIGFVIVKQA